METHNKGMNAEGGLLTNKLRATTASIKSNSSNIPHPHTEQKNVIRLSHIYQTHSDTDTHKQIKHIYKQTPSPSCWFKATTPPPRCVFSFFFFFSCLFWFLHSRARSFSYSVIYLFILFFMLLAHIAIANRIRDLFKLFHINRVYTLSICTIRVTFRNKVQHTTLVCILYWLYIFIYLLLQLLLDTLHLYMNLSSWCDSSVFFFRFFLNTSSSLSHICICTILLYYVYVYVYGETGMDGGKRGVTVQNEHEHKEQ